MQGCPLRVTLPGSRKQPPSAVLLRASRHAQDLLDSSAAGYEGPADATFNHFKDILDASTIDSTFMESDDFQGSLLAFTDQVKSAHSLQARVDQRVASEIRRMLKIEKDIMHLIHI